MKLTSVQFYCIKVLLYLYNYLLVVIARLERFINKPRFDNEAVLRLDIWDYLLDTMFDDFFCKYTPQKSLNLIDDRNRN